VVKENPYLKIGDTNDRSTKVKVTMLGFAEILILKRRRSITGIIGKMVQESPTLLKILSRLLLLQYCIIKLVVDVASLLEVERI
jgi:lipopolysaccharide transport system ATP-binding protein